MKDGIVLAVTVIVECAAEAAAFWILWTLGHPWWAFVMCIVSSIGSGDRIKRMTERSGSVR